MRQLAVFFLVAILGGCDTTNVYETPSQDAEAMKAQTFFDKYGQTELGSTKTVVANANIGERGPEQKMIDISVEDAGAVPVIVSFRVEYGAAVGIGGPLVGIIQYGTGGGETQVEFDIPSGRLPGLIAPIAQPPRYQPMTNTGSGLNVYLGGASHVSVYVRNDGFIASLQNVIGRAILVPSQTPNDCIGSPSPAKVIVHVQPAAGTGHPKLERSIWVCGGVLLQPESVITPNNGVLTTVPPFAKNVRVQRTPAGLPVQLNFNNNFGYTYRTINLGPNDEGPVEFDSATDSIFFINAGAANIDIMQAVFDVTPI